MTSRLHEVLAAFDGDLPLARAWTIPSAWYFDAEVYALERRAIFGDVWQVAGRLASVVEPRSFLTTDIAGEPVLVVRDGAGVLRAFFNVCRHRAAPVVTLPAGKASRLRCRYHGWTYDLAGRLRGTPEFDGVADFCREDEGLVELAVAVWGPLVWVHLGKQPPPLADHLAPLPERTAGLGIEALRFVERREYLLACNWKVFVDNYLDGGYHVNTVHPGLAGALDYAHYRTEVAGHTSVQTCPLRSPPALPSPTRGEGSSAPREGSSAPSPNLGEGKGGGNAAVASVRTGDTAQYWWVFPNFMLNLYHALMDTNLVLPLGPERCRVVFDFYFAQTEGEQARQFMKESMAVADRIQQEDMAICEEVQRGLGSRSFTSGRFSVRREEAGYSFHRLLARRLRAAQDFESR